MGYCIVIKNKWTGKETLYPVIYTSMGEAHEYIVTRPKINNTYEVKELK
jgi:hypothetical protein